MINEQEAIEAYPLCWPAGKPRTNNLEYSRFDTTFTWARTQLLEEVRLLGGGQPIISSNIPLRKDGLPYAKHRMLDDRGIAVYFTLKGKQMCFACDKWIAIEDNLHAIGKTINALRGIRRWGSDDMIAAAFTGFQALPAPGAKKAWHEVLGVSSVASEAEITAAYRKKAKEVHPDNGGSNAAFVEVNDAYREASK